MRVYVHGSGRTGRDAWPLASLDDAACVDFPTSLSLEQRIVELSAITPPEATVIAHSAGAIPAILATARGRIDVSALVLVEPALYDIARGVPAVEHHIEAMTSARQSADGDDLLGFWSIVRPMMFGAPADAASWNSERKLAAHFASIELPWGHDVSADMVTGVPTHVITGGWNDEYEAIAAALVTAGASHAQLIGNEHRPQDHPDFERMLCSALAR